MVLMALVLAGACAGAGDDDGYGDADDEGGSGDDETRCIALAGQNARI